MLYATYRLKRTYYGLQSDFYIAFRCFESVYFEMPVLAVPPHADLASVDPALIILMHCTVDFFPLVLRIRRSV